MASPMAVAVMTKKALELAEDKRVRTLLASIAAGIVIVMLIPLLVVVQPGGGKDRIRWRTHSNGY